MESQEQHSSLYNLRHLCAHGISETEPTVRAHVWRLLVGLVDINHDKQHWGAHLQQKRVSYWSIAEEICIRSESDTSLPFARHKSQSSTQGRDSTLERLYNDVMGTRSNHPLLYQRLKAPQVPRRRALIDRIDALKKIRTQTWFDPDLETRHAPVEEEQLWEGLIRLLFVFAAVNPTVGYVPCLIELASPFIFIFGRDDLSNVEADTFWALSSVVNGGISEILTPEGVYDARCLGLESMFAVLDARIASADPNLFDHLRDIDLRPQAYSMRWFRTAFAQAFVLPDLLRLWDAMLAETTSSICKHPPYQHKTPTMQFLIDTAAVVVIRNRDRLLSASSQTGPSIIQSAPTFVEMDVILADVIRAKQERQAQQLVHFDEVWEFEPVLRARTDAQKARADILNFNQASNWCSKHVNRAYQSDASARLFKTAINLAYQQFKADLAARAATTRESAISAVRPSSPNFDAPFRVPLTYSPLLFSPQSGYSSASPGIPSIGTPEPAEPIEASLSGPLSPASHANQQRSDKEC